MYDFIEWLSESKANHIRFGGFWNDGSVIVYIGSRRYHYVTDAVHHKKWRKMINYAPGRVLNQIKDMVKQGLAQQVDPPPIQNLQPKQENNPSCPNCGTPEPHYIQGIECPGCGLDAP